MQKDKTLRIDPDIHKIFCKIATKEDKTLKALFEKMVLFFDENKITFKDDIFTGYKKGFNDILSNQKDRFDYLIKLQKSFEKGYFEPIQRNVNQLWLMLESIKSELPDEHNEKQDIRKETDENVSGEEQNLTPKLSSEYLKQKKIIKESIKIFDNLMSKKTEGATSGSWVIRCTEDEINDVLNFINTYDV